MLFYRFFLYRNVHVYLKLKDMRKTLLPRAITRFWINHFSWAGCISLTGKVVAGIWNDFLGNWNLKKDFELFLNELHDAAALNDLPALCFAQLPRASCVHFTNGEPARECIRQVKIKCSSQLNSPQIGLKLEKNILISTKRFLPFIHTAHSSIVGSNKIIKVLILDPL